MGWYIFSLRFVGHSLRKRVVKTQGECDDDKPFSLYFIGYYLRKAMVKT